MTKWGVAKVNVASQTVHGMREDPVKQWSAKKNLSLTMVFGQAKEIAQAILKKSLTNTDAAERA